MGQPQQRRGVIQDARFYAHSLEHDPNPAHWQELEEHLLGVAEKAAQFAESFLSRDWGYLAGLWHDLGKYQQGFQAKLLGNPIFVEHSGAGAALAYQTYRDASLPLAFAIAGHHAGLTNPASSDHGDPSPLKDRLSDNTGLLDEMLRPVPPHLSKQRLPQLPWFLTDQDEASKKDRGALIRRHEFWIRFLFSALVDADRLDTEEFANPASAGFRGGFSAVSVLAERLDAYIDSKVANIPVATRRSSVNVARLHVLEACRQVAAQPPGVFRLTVPTGGGKTLSAMSFALRHAKANDLSRVIVVIPYTSIIDQNAKQYRDALGVENVVEHHSSFDPEKATIVHGEEVTQRHELACENWDTPIIVTTSVQFLETLFSNRPSRCRKLHNVSRSVILLDEVQTLPPGFLLSVLDALNELVAHYGCSIVLSTATPPALAERERFPEGLRNIRDIFPDRSSLAEGLQRVEYAWPGSQDSPLDWAGLAAELAKHRQVLAVVHKRDDARILAQHLQELMPEEPVLHLSALMCAAHRLDVLSRIKEALACDLPCRVVSTQLVEAGVDVDFPLVYRALGGLDSVVQAAGRCNREGRLVKGQVVIFRAPTSPPPGTPKKGMEIVDSLLRENDGTLDPDDPALVERYFRELYLTENKDSHNIQTNREQFNYATVGREFRIIEDGFTQSLVVPYGEAMSHLERLRREGPDRRGFRRLQPYIVNVYPNSFSKLMESGAIDQDENSIFSLALPFSHLYDDTFGLVVGDEPTADPSSLVV